MRGHLRDLNMMMPFSMERLSLGRPATDQILIVTSSPSTFLILTPLVSWMFKVLTFSLQSSSKSYLY